MKKICYILLSLFAVTSLSFAQQPPARPSERKTDAMPQSPQKEDGMILNMSKQRAEIIKQYDKNGDGKLDENERKAAFDAMKRRSNDLRAIKNRYIDDIIKKFDKDGDGKLNKPELREYVEQQTKMYNDKNDRDDKNQPRPDITVSEEMIKKFDKDGDGKLSHEEKKELMTHIGNQKDELIKKYDLNQNGRIDPDEFEQLSKDPNYQGELKRVMPKPHFEQRNRGDRDRPKDRMQDRQPQDRPRAQDRPQPQDRPQVQDRPQRKQRKDRQPEENLIEETIIESDKEKTSEEEK